MALAAALLTMPGIGAQAPPQTAVPADLKPLLAARTSEMRFVVTRYTLDRGILSCNYANGATSGARCTAGAGGASATGGGGRGGRGPSTSSGQAGTGADATPPAQPEVVPISPDRLARLKRFDVDWQAALGRIDATKLSAVAKTDLETLKSTVAANQKQLDADALTMAQVMPVVPIASKMVPILEARYRVDDVDSQKAAMTLTSMVRDMTELRARLEAGVSGGATGLRVSKALALRAADATDNLRVLSGEWFGFYNGYDPQFTWWMAVPFKAVTAAYSDYAKFLREKVAAADEQVAVTPATVAEVAPATAPKFSSVPDLAEILALPQDEMRDIVSRFMAGGGGRGGRGGGPSTGSGQGGAPAPDPKYFQEWLAALKTLDFDALTRNAQVDYLAIRHLAELRLSRVGVVIPPGPPRKADNLDLRGTPRGREGLIQDLQDAMIVYTPEQLITLANKEFAWCEEEMKKASREMGFGDDWKKAVEHTKQTAVPPGGQPRMIMGLLNEAVDYLRAKDLITVPSVAAESLHMTMMSPQEQLTSPFFLGGDHILVSYPTDTMEYQARMESMRGNNPGFSHATAFHEMIPGHNLVGYLGQRYQGYRANLGSGGAFFGEGWPLYWELTLYELGFDKTPEQRVGALFWRMHRCARIIFSLNFHMGLWSPQESVNFLVDKVGHEYNNAEAEVRRSFESPQYANQPLYQAAYLLGGLQLRGLRKELVDGKVMTNRQFHDEIMRQGNMPIALIRLGVTKMKLTRDMDIDWKFYGELPSK
jgi:uncharacterized protein (DUF885 family)